MWNLLTGNSKELAKTLAENSVDSIITDPPYGMNIAEWDKDVPDASYWETFNRCLKPGGFLLAFCSPRLYHRLATSIEDAGFEIVDQIMWMTTTKMPVSGKLKQCHEPIVVAQKKFSGTIKHNVETFGTGNIDIESTRVAWDKEPPKGWVSNGLSRRTFGGESIKTKEDEDRVDANPNGRYPSNIIGEVMPKDQSYFYAPRVTKKERGEYNNHPTPKPIDLMRYLVKMFCPTGGTVLDPFSGSGSTGIGAIMENRKYIGIELYKEYTDIAEQRLKDWSANSLSYFFEDEMTLDIPNQL